MASSSKTSSRGNKRIFSKNSSSSNTKKETLLSQNIRKRVVARDSSADPSKSMADDTIPNVSVGPSCSVDEPESCSLADLEILYVDEM